MSSPRAPIPNAVFTTFAFLGFVVCAVPFPYHLEAWNTGTCLYMFWAGFGCLNMFINSIVWNGNSVNWAPVWCDISTRLQVATHFAIPAASLCINRRLYHIASSQSLTASRSQKRRAIIVDFSIAFGYPCLMVALHYVVQGHRFDLVEDLGCLATTYNTTIAYVLAVPHPLIAGVISLIYALATMRVLSRKQARLNKDILAPHRNLTQKRYTRLRWLAGVELIATIPLASWTLAESIRGGIHPWISWEDTHYDFMHVEVYPAILWRRVPSLSLMVEFTRWAPVLCAFVFFAFFGFDHETRKNYRSVIEGIAERARYSSSKATVSCSPREAETTEGPASVDDSGASATTGDKGWSDLESADVLASETVTHPPTAHSSPNHSPV